MVVCVARVAWRRVCPLPSETRLMSRRRQSNRGLTDLAAEVAAEDGSDPKEFHRKPWEAPKAAGLMSSATASRSGKRDQSATVPCTVWCG